MKHYYKMLSSWANEFLIPVMLFIIVSYVLNLMPLFAKYQISYIFGFVGYRFFEAINDDIKLNNTRKWSQITNLRNKVLAHLLT